MRTRALKANPIRTSDWVIAAFCFFIILICLLPMVNILARSLSSADALIRNEVMLWPVGWNLSAYQTVFSDARYIHSLWYTAVLTIGCTFLSLTMTTLCAYPLIYDQLKGRKFFNTLFIITMYFGAGTIPTYLLLRSLKMLDTVWVLVVPNCLSVFNMIIMKNYLMGIPKSLQESAEIDGAGPVRVLLSIYLPLATPVLATLALFYAVGRWNGFSDALMYVRNRELYPIQRLLYDILNSSSSMETATQEGFTIPGIGETLKAASVMFATVPILLVYPWLQRYFIAGATLGAVKE